MFLPNKSWIGLAIIMIALFLPVTVWGQPESIKTLEPLPYSMAGLLLRVIASLLLIIFLTYFILKIVKKQHDLQQKQKSWIKIYDYQALGPNRGIYVVESFARVYLLGVSEGQINILQEINQDDPQWVYLKENWDKEDKEVLPLMFRYKELLERINPKAKSQPEPFSQKLKDQLDRTRHLSQHIKKGGWDHEK